MNSKLLFFFIIFALISNFLTFSESGDVLFDPKEIIIKPKAINGYLLFKVKYNTDDFKALVKKSIQNGTASYRFKQRGINEQNIYYYLGTWEWMGGTHDGHLEVSYYNESLIMTIRNIESNQEYKVLIFPFMSRAYVPGITIGKYKFEKLTLTVSLGGGNVFNSDIKLDSELPGFNISSNTAFIYGLINFKGGEIYPSNEEKTMIKLRKYIELVKKFKKNANLQVVELSHENYVKPDTKKDNNNSNENIQSEKILILNMLKEGKITSEEAEKLLKALK